MGAGPRSAPRALAPPCLSLPLPLPPLLLLLLLLLHLPLARGDCGAPDRLPYAVLSGDSAAQESFPVGSTVRYTCRPGYQRNHNFPATRTCLPDGTWSKATEFCEKKRCPNIGELINGHINIEEDIVFGSTIYFSCDKGFLLVGQPESRCEILSDTQVGWSEPLPKCQGICCPSPVIDGKKLHFNNDCQYKEGNTYTVHCRSYHRRSTCQRDGRWKPEISPCQNDYDCRSPKTIANGNYKISNRFFGADVIYSCNDGYVLIGEAKITCRNSGWSHAFPHCQALCPKPEISNGQMSSEKIWYRSNENAQVQCSPGYYLVGPQIITCSENRSWIPEVPKCELKFPEGCEKVSAGYKLMQCLPNTEDVKMALEIYKLTLEIEMLELEINKKRDTNQS